MSSEWISADEAQRMGLAWKVCEPDDLLPEARRHAEILASRPVSSLMAVKQTTTTNASCRQSSPACDRRTGDKLQPLKIRQLTEAVSQRTIAHLIVILNANNELLRR